ncbi:glycoprotein [Dolphin rhabdovirus]|uniref:Glycoprotein n=1 Tax=Dolphin rhabdovirus TaxID=1511639 RepID=A0A068ERZ2_9RHAB|nr:glycoprotein [Dolphin rhabdovirus]AID53191.1 glycoprotein [Dolphin rhabdovirus]
MYIHILLMILVSGVFGTVIFVPTGKLNWTPDSIHNLTCPSYIKIYEGHPKQMRYAVYTAPADKEMYRDGFICATTTWSVTCDFRWYGSKYISHEVVVKRTTPDQCKFAIKEYQEGLPELPTMPAESCGWNNVLTESKDYVTVTPHSVRLDPYGMVYVDSEFKDGRCSEQVCQTPNHRGIWLPKTDKGDQCSQVSASMVTLSPNRPDGKWTSSTILVSGTKELQLSKACKLSFCGKDGFRFANGEWFSFLGGLEKGIEEIVKTLDRCPMDTIIHTHNSHSDLSRIEAIAYENALQVNCYQELRRASETKKVSNFLLSFFTPLHEGLGIAHRINKGQLETASAYYTRVKLADHPTLDNLGMNSKGQTVSYKDLVPVTTEKGSGMSLFNGNTVKDGKINWVLSTIQQSIIKDLEEDTFGAEFIQHPHAKHLPSYLNETIIKEKGQGTPGDVITSIKHWAGGLWQSISASLFIGLLLILIGLVIFKVLIKYLFKCPRSSEKIRTPHIEEMGLMRTEAETLNSRTTPALSWFEIV